MASLMPWKPATPCRAAGCNKLVRPPGYCPDHARQSLAHEYDEQRGTSTDRGYDYAWQKLRLWFLSLHPLCQAVWGSVRCTRAATEVHHIIPRKKGGTDDPDNLQALCHQCHTRIERLLGGMGADLQSGRPAKTAAQSHAHGVVMVQIQAKVPGPGL